LKKESEVSYGKAKKTQWWVASEDLQEKIIGQA